MSERQIYLQDIALDQAWRRFDAALAAAGQDTPLPGQPVPVAEAHGRVTAAPIWARLSSPHYHASAMDGYAVRAADTEGATETTPLQLTLIEPSEGREVDVPRPAQAVNTGQPLPPWANAVIMIENVQHHDGKVEIMASVAPYQHVRPLGEDMVATELVLPANHRLRPVDLGAIAGAGHSEVWVRREPRVAIIPTGSELVSVEDLAPPASSARAEEKSNKLRPGDIVEYNSIVLAAQVSAWGGKPTRWPIVPDELEAIKAAVLQAASDHDLVLVNAGSSAGSKDYTAQVVQEVGELLVHGVAVRPGHPVILGMLGQKDSPQSQTPVIGVPGYPVSAALTGEIFVESLLSRWLGRPPESRPQIKAKMTRKIQSPLGDDEFMRVAVGQVGEHTVAAPLSRGAGVITSLVRADGIVRIPRFSEGVHAGAEVTVQLYRDPAEIERSIVAIGSHDLVLDLLAQFMAERAPGMRLTSANAGSLGGMVALRRGEAHLAGSHLLHPESGEYNVAYVQQYLPRRPVTLVTLTRREQGLIVAPGNPKSITKLSDLTRSDVSYVNRQRGAGTRVLLDYRLSELGIDPSTVQGYRREEVTHLAVAAAVASGVADCGLGIRAAARALELDFVPIEWERYDLVIPQEHYGDELLAPLLTLLKDAEFRGAVSELPGYDPSPMGQIVAQLVE